MKIIWYMIPEIWGATDAIFLSLWAIVCSSSHWRLGNQNFEKLKKAPGDNIILKICTINYNHMIYGSWDMELERRCLLSFWTVFCPFTSLRTQKIKLFKKQNNTWRYYNFKNVYHKLQSYDLWFLRYPAWRTDFFFIWIASWLFFYPTNNPINQFFLKNGKKTWLLLSFYKCAP